MKNFFADLWRHKNRTFAILFAALGLVFFVAYYAVLWATSSSSFFSSWSGILNFLIVGYVYLTIFICNVNNDGKAFRGVSAFIFMITFTQILNLILYLIQYSTLLSRMSGMQLAFLVLQLAFLAGQIAMGVCYYMSAMKYMGYGSVPFSRVRLFGILFAATMFLSLFFERGLILTSVLSGNLAIDFLNFLLLFGLPISECLYAVSVIFTFERLRRE